MNIFVCQLMKASAHEVIFSRCMLNESFWLPADARFCPWRRLWSQHSKGYKFGMCVAWWFKSQCVARTSTLKHQVLCRFMACLAVASWGSSNWPRWRDYTVPWMYFIIEYVFGQSSKYTHQHKYKIRFSSQVYVSMIYQLRTLRMMCLVVGWIKPAPLSMHTRLDTSSTARRRWQGWQSAIAWGSPWRCSANRLSSMLRGRMTSGSRIDLSWLCIIERLSRMKKVLEISEEACIGSKNGSLYRHTF